MGTLLCLFFCLCWYVKVQENGKMISNGWSCATTRPISLASQTIHSKTKAHVNPLNVSPHITHFANFTLCKFEHACLKTLIKFRVHNLFSQFNHPWEPASSTERKLYSGCTPWRSCRVNVWFDMVAQELYISSTNKCKEVILHIHHIGMGLLAAARCQRQWWRQTMQINTLDWCWCLEVGEVPQACVTVKCKLEKMASAIIVVGLKCPSHNMATVWCMSLTELAVMIKSNQIHHKDWWSQIHHRQ